MFKHTLRKEGQRAKQPRGKRETFRQGREGWERGGLHSQTDTQLGRTTKEPDLHGVTQVPKGRKVGEGGEHTPSSHTEQGTRQGRDTGSLRLWSVRGEAQGAGGKEPEGTPAPERRRGQPEAQRPTCQRESAITGGQEVECEKDTEACVGRGAHVRGHTRTNTHTHRVIHSQPETQVWNQRDPVTNLASEPRVREKDLDTQRHTQSLIHRDTEGETKAAPPGETPCQGGPHSWSPCDLTLTETQRGVMETSRGTEVASEL